MDHFEEKSFDIAYIIPHENKDLTLRVRHTANAWWKDVTKVFSLLDAFDNHGASISEACMVAHITRRQYKYFAQEHPVIYLRIRRAKFARREEKMEKEKSILARRMLAGDTRAAAQFLFFDERPQFDRRFKSDRARLKRVHGMPAQTPTPKYDEEKLEDMETAAEKTRAIVGHPSNPKHYAECDQCRHLLGPTEIKEKEAPKEPTPFFF